MTLDDDVVEQSIIDALKNDATAPVPPERSQRLASRLAAGAGIMGLTTSVAGATHAAIASGSALGGGAVAATGSALGTSLTLVGLTKTLLVGMGLGAGAGLGLYATFRSSAPASSAMQAPLVVPAAAAVTSARAAPLAAVPPTALTGDGVVAPERPAPSPPPPDARTNPSPELPRDSAPEKARSLAEQQALLDEARGALRRGDGNAALAALRQHLARFPQTVFDEEREAVAIKALLLIGQRDAARQREAAFERRYPASLLTHSLRAAVGTSNE